MPIIDEKLKRKVIKDYISNSSFPQTISVIAQRYGIRPSSVSKILHEAIVNIKVNRKTAVKIGEIATENTRRAGHSHIKTREFYDNLLEIYDQTISMISYDIITLKDKREKYLFLISSFDETFSDSDEILFTKEDLEREVDHISSLIRRNEELLKNK